MTTERFTLLDADQVIDRDTDLIWTRASLGKFNWKDAQKACNRCVIGRATWRLPTIQELITLVDYERSEPAIDPVFKCESDCYWTHTPYAGAPAVFAWVVRFGDGASYYDNQVFEYYVRAVRPRGMT
jgi:Protein of unknown function (DUF1566)